MRQQVLRGGRCLASSHWLTIAAFVFIRRHALPPIAGTAIGCPVCMLSPPISLPLPSAFPPSPSALPSVFLPGLSALSLQAPVSLSDDPCVFPQSLCAGSDVFPAFSPPVFLPSLSSQASSLRYSPAIGGMIPQDVCSASVWEQIGECQRRESTVSTCTIKSMGRGTLCF